MKVFMKPELYNKKSSIILSNRGFLFYLFQERRHASEGAACCRFKHTVKSPYCGPPESLETEIQENVVSFYVI